MKHDETIHFSHHFGTGLWDTSSCLDPDRHPAIPNPNPIPITPSPSHPHPIPPYVRLDDKFPVAVGDEKFAIE